MYVRMYVCPSVCMYVRLSGLGGNVIFSAPNWDKVLIFSSEATLWITTKVCLYVCLSGLGENVIFSRPLIEIEY